MICRCLVCLTPSSSTNVGESCSRYPTDFAKLNTALVDYCANEAKKEEVRARQEPPVGVVAEN